METLGLPENHLRAQKLAAFADERIDGDIQVAPLAVTAAQPHRAGDGPALREHQHHRSAFRGDGVAGVVFGSEKRAPHIFRHFTGFVIVLAKNGFCGLVVVDECAGCVDQQDGHVQTAGQLSGEDNLYGFGSCHGLLF